MQQRNFEEQTLTVAALVLCLCLGPGVHAQEASVDAQLSVESPDACITEPHLRERLQQYRTPVEQAHELRVRVGRRDGVLEFVLLQRGQAVARRQFPQLSAACDERLDSVALAIAVALNSAGSQALTPAAPSGVGAPGADQPYPASAPLGPRPDARQAPPTNLQRRAVYDERRRSQHDAQHPSSTRLPPTAAALGPSEARADHTRDSTQARVTEPQHHEASSAAQEARQVDPHAAEVGDSRKASSVDASPLASDDARAEVWQARGTEVQQRAANEHTAGPSQPSAAGVMADARPVSAPIERVRVRGPRAGDVGVSVGARYGLEVLPDPLLLFDLGIEVGLTRTFSLQAAGVISPAQISAADGGQMRAQLTGGELLACARPTAGNVMLRWCAGAAAASVSARGEDFLVDRHARLAWVAGLMRAAVRWPADSPVAAELVLSGHANLVRPRMRILQSNEPDRVSLVLGGSLGAQLLVSLR